MIDDRTFGDLHLAETVYPAGLSMPMHGHGPAYISCVMAGGYSERSRLKSTEQEARSFVFRPPDSEHAVHFAGPTKIFRVEIGEATLGKLSEAEVSLKPDACRQTTGAKWLVGKTYQEFAKGEDASRLLIESLLMQLLAEAFCEDNRPPDLSKARAAKDFLHGRFREPISLQDAAAANGTHPVYLARAFKKSYGSTVGEYVRRLRLNHASELIAKTDMPLGEVALESGFADQAHLTKALRQVAGATPATYRRFHRM